MNIIIDPGLPLHHVGMGQLSVGTHGEQLQALLGSCIGIGFIWKNGPCCGLAHCLLPEAPGTDSSLGARYVSQAVPSLLRMMGVRQADYADIEVVLAGGASMFGPRNGRLQVGRQNAEAAQKYLDQCGLSVSFCALGGRHGRQLLIDCANHSYAVTDVVAQPELIPRKEGAYGYA
ncbi:chemotaxis protein CheD [Janthinobacterium lividum]|uniref:Chemotaxis protein CheD n=1 Tax=Janthinobacterium lividum TaxID=29581 RepID=A0ABU0XMN4_9BURK|nr:chemotaxis protein CheD [Janthinobacterium lividum]MBR7634617.1 chemotaxis protein CheD [Janthinobacterium lividum]MDQ4624783.1 chemotaxis protein CheD [Janthinobacterium lividum]MDQ4673614.1 chemotaxis protein CheD [Janthinobacterium lividum]MDQ4684344.1 chemotaxis protein CheD [Janthinobacterium lividum]